MRLLLSFVGVAAFYAWHLSFVAITGTLVIGLGLLCFNMLPQGGSLSVRAVFGISLLPTVLLSLGSWIVRRKFLTMKNQHDLDAETRQRSG